jgi:hypothetical protein
MKHNVFACVMNIANFTNENSLFANTYIQCVTQHGDNYD